MRKEKLESVRAIDIFDGVNHFPINNPEEVYIRDEGVEVVTTKDGKKYRSICATPYYTVNFKD